MSRRPLFAGLALLLTVAVTAVACGDDNSSSTSSSSSKPTVFIATQAFGESEIVGQIYGQVFTANGFHVTYQSFKDRASIYTAFDGGDKNFMPEYAASGLEYLNNNAGEATSDITTTAAKLNERLAQKKLVALNPTKAVDTNSLVVTKSTSEKDHLTKISQLTEAMKLGGPQDCPTNAGCIPALMDKYGINMLKNFVPLDLSGPLTKKALENGDVDVAVIFSTDSSIALNHWIVLKDEKGIFKADNIIPVLTQKLAQNTQIKDLTNKVSATLTTENVTAMNKQFDIDKQDASAIAKQFISEHGLAKS
jgi:osmoprotectant transport system substrate-binding protein